MNAQNKTAKEIIPTIVTIVPAIYVKMSCILFKFCDELIEVAGAVLYFVYVC